MTLKKFEFFLMALVLWAHPGCSSSDEGNQEDDIIIGGVFADDVDELSLRELNAARMAIDEINASGVFKRKLKMVNLSPARGDFIDPDRAAENVKTLYDEYGAMAFIGGHGGDASYKMISVTNTDAYSDFVQCADSASDPGSNIPGMQGADTTDSFFRLVVSYSVHIDLGAKIFRDNGWFKIGLFRLDDVFGQEVSLGIRLKVSSEEGFSMAFDLPVPTDSFDVEANRDKMDQAIALSKEGEVGITILAVLQAQTIGLVKYFTENGFQGPLFLTTGSNTSDLFSIATNIGTWMGGENLMMGIEPNNYAGINSDEFVQKFKDRYEIEPSNHSSNAYDCAYVLAFGLLYAGDNPTRAGIKEGLQKFKEANRRDDEVVINLGSEEFARAAEAIRSGKQIDFQGASGRLMFDENGDRPKQDLCTFGPNADATAFETKDCYDEDFNKL